MCHAHAVAWGPDMESTMNSFKFALLAAALLATTPALGFVLGYCYAHDHRAWVVSSSAQPIKPHDSEWVTLSASQRPDKIAGFQVMRVASNFSLAGRHQRDEPDGCRRFLRIGAGGRCTACPHASRAAPLSRC